MESHFKLKLAFHLSLFSFPIHNGLFMRPDAQHFYQTPVFLETAIVEHGSYKPDPTLNTSTNQYLKPPLT